MKSFLSILALATVVVSNALAAEIKSATVDTEAALLHVVVESKQHCNTPKFDVVYQYSGRAAFGPFHFQLQETPIGRMRCQGSEEIKLVFGLQKIGQCSTQYRVVNIEGDNGTAVQLQLNERN